MGPLIALCFALLVNVAKLSFLPYLPNLPVSPTFMGPLIALCFALLAILAKLSFLPFLLLRAFLDISPRINRSLTEFTDAHNNHAESTERNNSPAQLFWLNLHLTAFGGGRSSDDAWRGMNVRDFMSSQTLPHVEVPDTSNPLSNEFYLRLQSIVEPSGKDLYRCAVQMVGKMMQQQDSND